MLERRSEDVGFGFREFRLSPEPQTRQFPYVRCTDSSLRQGPINPHCPSQICREPRFTEFQSFRNQPHARLPSESNNKSGEVAAGSAGCFRGVLSEAQASLLPISGLGFGVWGLGFRV